MAAVKTIPVRRRPESALTLAEAFRQWRLPALPGGLRDGRRGGARERLTLTALGRQSRSRLAHAGSARARARLELSLVDWLWAAIRGNIRRGRLFEMDRVLAAGEADCLGYARVFQDLGRALGLDAGIVEVLVDNAGRAVPHVVNIVRLAGGRIRFVDLWYGSRNIRHRRLGLRARRRWRWRVIDVDRRDLRRWEDIRGLPPRCVDAIAAYMIGNRHLDRGTGLGEASELREAVRCYTAALEGYPGNSRIRFNRAVALENLGDRLAARVDYEVALQGKAGLIRVQARQHDEVVQLMALDRMGVSSRDEEIYLCCAGFTTGKGVPPERVAARCGLPVRVVDRITRRIRSRLAGAPPPPA